MSARTRVGRFLDSLLHHFPLGVATIRMSDEGVRLQPVDIRTVVSGRDVDGRSAAIIREFLDSDEHEIIFEREAIEHCRLTRADLAELIDTTSALAADPGEHRVVQLGTGGVTGRFEYDPERVGSVSVIGEPGTGKTTLLRAFAAGLLRRNDVDLTVIGTADFGFARDHADRMVDGQKHASSVLDELCAEMREHQELRIHRGRLAVVVVDDLLALACDGIAPDFLAPRIDESIQATPHGENIVERLTELVQHGHEHGFIVLHSVSAFLPSTKVIGLMHASTGQVTMGEPEGMYRLFCVGTLKPEKIEPYTGIGDGIVRLGPRLSGEYRRVHIEASTDEEFRQFIGR